MSSKPGRNDQCPCGSGKKYNLALECKEEREVVEERLESLNKKQKA
ncbi:MAG: SEC-C metal-binding domain-containing protein [Methanobacteriota archaeon]